MISRLPDPPDLPTGPLVVAIDGPSGSGKSSVSREVARRLGLAYLDTGAMYRAVCWRCLELGVDLDDTAVVAALCQDLDLAVSLDPLRPGTWVSGQDVAAEIRASRISGLVSKVATNLQVRADLRARQRDLIRQGGRQWGGCVAEGRDITTVVAPQAQVRILLTASESARLARRARELHGHDDERAVGATRDEVLRRDADDATVSTFHTAADGVIELDSSGLDFEQTVRVVLDLVSERAELQLDGAPAEARR